MQRAFGRGKRTYTGFASRFQLPVRGFDTSPPGPSSQGVKAFVERAVAASSEADRQIAELQDSMLPIESGDAELRAGLAETRELLDGLPGFAREFTRVLGR